MLASLQHALSSHCGAFRLLWRWGWTARKVDAENSKVPQVSASFLYRPQTFFFLHNVSILSFFFFFFLPTPREREQPPHFAQPGTFEFEYASRWKALQEMEKQQREQVDKNIREAKEKLEAELESAKHEHQLMLMRQGGGFFFWLSQCDCCVSYSLYIRLSLSF